MYSKFLKLFIELYPLVSALVAVLVAQVLKSVTHYISQGDLNIKRIRGSGGMPSSHTAMVVSLATAIGLKEGWTSSLFCMATVFAIIVMYDAAGVRRATGQQASILNQLIEGLFETGEFRTEKLSELVGHTPIEVLAGACLGVGIAFTLYY